MGACAPRPERLEPGGEVWLRAWWKDYRSHYMSPAGFVVDPLRDGMVTSEAQSYALLQAASLAERDAFELVWRWTREHLRRADGLFSWLWDPRTGRPADINSATDADQDIAFALILAAHAFARPDYLDEAAQAIRAIRANASLQLAGIRFPSAGNWAEADRIINLSYFSPYAYRYFHRSDPDGHWLAVVDAGYQLIATAARGDLLPADFNSVDANGGLAPVPPAATLSRAFSYDAIRILWRIEFDCRVSRDPRACDASSALLMRLESLRRRDGRFVTKYDTTGSAATSDESPSFAAAFLPAYARLMPDVAATLRSTTLSPEVLQTVKDSSRRYYDANWIWFGFAMASGELQTRLPRLPPAAAPTADRLH